MPGGPMHEKDRRTVSPSCPDGKEMRRRLLTLRGVRYMNKAYVSGEGRAGHEKTDDADRAAEGPVQGAGRRAGDGRSPGGGAGRADADDRAGGRAAARPRRPAAAAGRGLLAGRAGGGLLGGRVEG